MSVCEDCPGDVEEHVPGAVVQPLTPAQIGRRLGGGLLGARVRSIEQHRLRLYRRGDLNGVCLGRGVRRLGERQRAQQ